jgi:hypothetical protein
MTSVDEPTKKALAAAMARYPALWDEERHPDAHRHQADEDFHDARRKYDFTASQVAAALACDPYKSFKEFIRVARGGEPKEPEEFAMTNFILPGREWEAKLAESLRSEFSDPARGLFLICGTYRHIFDYNGTFSLGASPDGFFLAPSGQLYTMEIKLRASKTEVRDMPLTHWLQVQCQLLTTGLPQGIYIATAADNTWVALVPAMAEVYFLEADLSDVWKIVKNAERPPRAPFKRDAQAGRYKDLMRFDAAVVVEHGVYVAPEEQLHRIAEGITALLDNRRLAGKPWLKAAF